MAGLNEVRRWVNLSRLEQRVYNSRQGNYESVMPNAFVQGPQYVGECNNPSFRETTAHLTQAEFYERLQQEKDSDLLKRLAMIERNEFTPRETIVKMIDARIKKLASGKVEDGPANSGDGGGPGTEKAGSAGAGATTI